MLIECPECNNKISDKAVSCPHCGLPMEKDTTRKKTTRSKRHMKLPNGMGNITKLSGKRRKPYAAYPPVTEFKENGSAIRSKAIGYFETYNDAFIALMDYRKSPEDYQKLSYTFEEVYELWWKDKFEDPASKITFSKSTMNSYKVAYKKCSSLYKRPMKTIVKDDMQPILDGIQMSFSSARNVLNLFSEMFKYAIANGMAEVNYSAYLKIKQEANFQKGVPFTSEEIKILWKHKDNDLIAIALILIYTGMRVHELEVNTIDLKNMVIVGGIKTKAGKDRTIPIHKKIVPLLKKFDQKKFVSKYYSEKFMHPALVELGLGFAENGAKHTPHDCRHTFSWLADKYGMDSVCKHLIMGHSLGNDVEVNTYGHRTIEELRAEMDKITE